MAIGNALPCREGGPQGIQTFRHEKEDNEF
jgi:hypothetical protein